MTTELISGVREGNPRALGQAISLAENGEADDLLNALGAPHQLHRVIGITGAPGVGKSTLVSSLITSIRNRGLSVAAILVDPSSALTGGSLLGDRIRLGGHTGDDKVFIRSLATRGHLGGLTAHINDVVSLVQHSPFDVIILETVGVGQSEVEVMHHADVVCFVVSPGQGDGVQISKAGVLEIADVIAINKSDMDGVEKTANELQHGDLVAHRTGQPIQILQTVATTGRGVAGLLDTLLSA